MSFGNPVFRPFTFQGRKYVQAGDGTWHVASKDKDGNWKPGRPVSDTLQEQITESIIPEPKQPKNQKPATPPKPKRELTESELRILLKDPKSSILRHAFDIGKEDATREKLYKKEVDKLLPFKNARARMAASRQFTPMQNYRAMFRELLGKKPKFEGPNFPVPQAHDNQLPKETKQDVQYERKIEKVPGEDQYGQSGVLVKIEKNTKESVGFLQQLLKHFGIKEKNDAIAADFSQEKLDNEKLFNNKLLNALNGAAGTESPQSNTGMAPVATTTSVGGDIAKDVGEITILKWAKNLAGRLALPVLALTASIAIVTKLVEGFMEGSNESEAIQEQNVIYDAKKYIDQNDAYYKKHPEKKAEVYRKAMKQSYDNAEPDAKKHLLQTWTNLRNTQNATNADERAAIDSFTSNPDAPEAPPLQPIPAPTTQVPAPEIATADSTRLPPAPTAKKVTPPAPTAKKVTPPAPTSKETAQKLAKKMQGLRPEIVNAFYRIENDIGKPLMITSGLRNSGPHATGEAIDIGVSTNHLSDADEQKIVQAALKEGITGVGVELHAPGGPHIHLDMSHKKLTAWGSDTHRRSLMSEAPWAEKMVSDYENNLTPIARTTGTAVEVSTAETAAAEDTTAANPVMVQNNIANKTTRQPPTKKGLGPLASAYNNDTTFLSTTVRQLL